MKKNILSKWSFYLLLFLLIPLCTACGLKNTPAHKQDYKLIEGTNFSNGLAWIKGADKEGDLFIGAIDPQGQLVFKVEDADTDVEFTLHEDGETPNTHQFSKFNSCSAVMLLDDGRHVIINHEGKILNTLDKNIDIVPGGDYYLAKQAPSGYAYDIAKVGVLDKDGQWITPLHDITEDEKGFWNTCGDFLTREETVKTKIGTVKYLGDSYFVSKQSKNTDTFYSLFYNVQTNHYFKITMPTNVEKQTISNLYYYDNQFLVVSSEFINLNDHRHHYYLYNTDGSYNKELDFGTANTDSELLTDATCVFDSSKGIIYTLFPRKSGELGSRGFIGDTSGNLLFDFKDLGNVKIERLKLANEGYIAVGIEGIDGYYTTLMKSDGTYCFEPRKTYASDKILTICTEDYANNTIVIQSDYDTFQLTDLEGTVKKELTFDDETFSHRFADGLCLLGGSMEYINTEGDIIVEHNPFAESEK
ncbi:hypothetical protein [Eubacterium barkeri]|uniref:WG containing repeat-containing protein n=1 Tax=Eubacterium barkeri TaxID=1528 RepID=A0A1H3IJC8_EUBBA|nr:hypothetical protein [Eubacterium barkeri]SDY27168.1 hypothetical protein SAMN04488579_12323 [Eubacterium barkeri]